MLCVQKCIIRKLVHSIFVVIIDKYGQNFLGQLGLDYLWPLSFMFFISYLV